MSAHKQLAVERVIVKIFQFLRLNVAITDRIRSLFSTKLHRMGRSLQSLGGSRGKCKQLEKWKQTNWVIELRKDEIVSKKRQSENPAESKIKMAKLENELKESKAKLCDATNQIHFLEQSTKELSCALAESGSSKTKRKRRKHWPEYSKRYKRKRKKMIATHVSAALKFLEDDCFAVENVLLTNKETREVISIKDGKTIAETNEKIPENETTKRTLFIKDKYNLSNQAYHELAMVNPTLPRLYTVSKTAKELNSVSIIRPTPGKEIGVQQSLKEKLHQRIKHLIQLDPSITQSPLLKVKITGDGTCVSRSMHVVVIAFTIIGTKEHPNSPGGNHVLALINTNENYDGLKEATEDICDEIKHTKDVEVEGVKFNIEYYLCADWKFLAICVGIDAANATYACIWCKCPSSDRHDISKTWSLTDPGKGARSIEEIQNCAKKRKNAKDKYNCSRQPIFPIPLDHIVPDILHLFLRITDVLINLLILELRRLDSIEKVSSHSKDSTLLEKYEKYLNEQCKVSFHFYTDHTSKALKHRDLTGPEKYKVFSKIQIPELFPSLPQAKKVQDIWSGFSAINEYLKSSEDFDSERIKSFSRDVKNWLNLFLSVYRAKHVTPYIHLLVHHIPEFLILHRSLAPFSQQGLEKLNDIITKDYFKSTNHHHLEALRQILQKLNRLEILEDDKCSRLKTTHVCGICEQPGHNARTCPKK